MISFRKMCEDMEVTDQVKSIIQRGLEIRPDRADGNTFWDDFITVIGNNSEGASDLLGVSSSVISQWSSKIKKALGEVKDTNKKRSIMLPTRHN